ncbi:LacI family transcriptional regulator, partial [Streptomyces sp. JAC18]
RGSPERELTYRTLLQRPRAAAVVLPGGALEDPAHQAAMAAKLARLADAGPRIVFCGRPPLPDADAVTAALAFDNRGGA